MRTTTAAVAAALVLWAAPAPGQQFDSYGDRPIEGFELPLGGLGLPAPALDPDGGLAPDGSAAVPLSLPAPAEAGMPAFPDTATPITSISQPQTAQANRIVLRALDRMLGQPTDVELRVGETAIYGRIEVHVRECRYPSDDPASDAYAYLDITDQQGVPLFEGWMIASSPVLNALEHPRYDVWVLRCWAE